MRSPDLGRAFWARIQPIKDSVMGTIGVLRQQGDGELGARRERATWTCHRMTGPGPRACGHVASHGKGTLQVGLSQGPEMGMILDWGGGQYHHKGPHKREVGGSESEMIEAVLLAVMMEKGATSQGRTSPAHTWV